VVQTKLYLIRHASADSVGKYIAGWLPGIRLNADGERQAEDLAETLGTVPLAAVYSSPLERARQTADCIARQHRVAVRASDALGEIHYGDWTGKTFADLESLPEWRMFNTFRSHTRIPGGDLFVEVQSRAVVELERIVRLHPRQSVAVVTHADVIRAIIGYYAGMQIDSLLRIEISPASISVIEIGDSYARIVCTNCVGSTGEMAA
jgi:broad specificity phosphatase PhoE